MEQSTAVSTESNNEISIVAVTLGIYFMMMPFDSFPMFGMGSLLRIFALFPVAAILVVKLRFSLQVNSLTMSFLIYCLILFASYFYSIYQPATYSYLKRIFLNMVIILCAGGMYEYNEAEIEFLKKSLVIGGLATLFLTLMFADYSSSGRLTLSINGVEQDQNYLNGYLFFAFVYFVSNLVQKKRVLSAVPIGGIIFFTLMTGSRGALVALLGIGAVTAFYILYRNQSINVGTILILAAVAALLVLLYEPVLTLLPESVAERYSVDYIMAHGNTGRSEIWKYLLGRFLRADLFRTLFGHGYSTVVIVNEYNHLVAHNLWIDHLIMVGAVGELIFISMQLLYVRAAWKSGDPFLLGSYVGYLVMMMTLSLMSYKPIWNCMIMIMIIHDFEARKAEKISKEEHHGLSTI